MALKTIHLHGLLAEKFGPVHKLHIDTVQEAGRALAVLFPGFRDEVRDKHYRVKLGPIDLNERELGIRIGDVHEVHIIPVLEGSGGGGKVPIILGAALVAASFVPGLQFLAPIGVAMAIGGVAQMLSPSPKTPKESKSKDEKTSFLFNGPVNVIQQGGCVPLAYGEVLAGSIVASAGIIVEQLLMPVGGGFGPAPPPPGPPPPPPSAGRAFSTGFSSGFS